MEYNGRTLYPAEHSNFLTNELSQFTGLKDKKWS
jgi:hypothetical protein